MSNPYSAPESHIQDFEQNNFDRSNPFSIKGRFGRLSYLAWAFIVNMGLFVAMMLVNVFLLDHLSLIRAETPEEMVAVYFSGTGMMLLILILINIVTNALFSIRRLHDINMSGFWVTLLFIPLINIIFGIFLMSKKGMLEVNQYALPRYTPTWEKVVGIICLVVIGFYILLILFPFILFATSGSGS